MKDTEYYTLEEVGEELGEHTHKIRRIHYAGLIKMYFFPDDVTGIIKLHISAKETLKLQKIFLILKSGFNMFSLKIALKIASMDNIIEVLRKNKVLVSLPSRIVLPPRIVDVELSYRIEELELSSRERGYLKKAGINSLPELIKKSESDLLKINGIGKKTVNKIIKRIKYTGCDLATSNEPIKENV